MILPSPHNKGDAMIDEKTLKQMREEKEKDLEAIDRVLSMMGAARKPVAVVEPEAPKDVKEEAPPRINFDPSLSKMAMVGEYAKAVSGDFTNESLWHFIESKGAPKNLARDDLRIALWMLKRKNIIFMVSKQSGKRKAVYRYTGG